MVAQVSGVERHQVKPADRNGKDDLLDERDIHPGTSKLAIWFKKPGKWDADISD